MPPVGECQLVIDALPGTIGEIVGKTQLAESTIRRWIRRLRAAEPPQAHIGQWKRKSGVPTPRHFHGPGEDARKPKAKTPSQQSKKWRKQKREDKAARADALAKTMEHAAQISKTPQTWMSSIMQSHAAPAGRAGVELEQAA